MAQVVVPTRAMFDGGAITLIGASFAHWLPPLAALVGMIYYLLLISENRRFLQLIGAVKNFRVTVPVWFHVTLVEDWRNFWKWFSIRFLALAASLQTTLVIFPDVLRQYLPLNYVQGLVTFLFICAAISTIVDQPKLKGRCDVQAPVDYDTRR
jgi:hypothetical protein